MRTAEEMAQESLRIAKTVFGLKTEPTGDLFGSARMGDMPRLEMAMKLVMYEEESKLRLELADRTVKYNIHNHNEGNNRNIHEWVGPKPDYTGEPEGLPKNMPT